MADLSWLANELGLEWKFKVYDEEDTMGPQALLHKGLSWAAEFKELGKTAHAVVVDGINDSGQVLVRDPWKGTKYEMAFDDFKEVWTGRCVVPR
jgi:hypothetical protein